MPQLSLKKIRFTDPILAKLWAFDQQAHQILSYTRNTYQNGDNFAKYVCMNLNQKYSKNRGLPNIIPKRVWSWPTVSRNGICLKSHIFWKNRFSLCLAPLFRFFFFKIRAVLLPSSKHALWSRKICWFAPERIPRYSTWLFNYQHRKSWKIFVFW